MSLTLAERVRSGDARAMARAISLIEDEAETAAGLVRDIFPHTGRTYLVGVTGPPGAGKSTLVDRLITHTRQAGETLGVIAVDPTSPFTGGAILGDRVRMQAHAADDRVHRSMATRGHMGGLARTTRRRAGPGAGKSLVISKPSGRQMIDIVRTADISTWSWCRPGDDVQRSRRGSWRSPHYVVNKCDRGGAAHGDAIKSNLACSILVKGMAPRSSDGSPTAGDPALWGRRWRSRAFGRHAAGAEARNEFRLRDLLTQRFMETRAQVLASGEFEALVEACQGESIRYRGVGYSERAISRQVVSRRAESQPDESRFAHVGIAGRICLRRRVLRRARLHFEAANIASQRVRATFINTGQSTTFEISSDRADRRSRVSRKRGPGCITSRCASRHRGGAGAARARRPAIDERRGRRRGPLVAFMSTVGLARRAGRLSSRARRSSCPTVGRHLLAISS